MMIYDAFVSAGKAVDSVSVTPIAAAIGFPEDQIRLFLIWFIQFPFGWFLHFCVRSKNVNLLVNHSMLDSRLFTLIRQRFISVAIKSDSSTGTSAAT